MVSAATTAASDVPDQASEPGFYKWYVVAVLFIGYCFSAIDARVLTLLVGPIKQDLGLSDFQISLLQGFAFSLFYSLAAIPIGRFVDTSKKRSRLVVVGVLFWSVMTMACGLAKNFTALFLTRVGVGVGEATLSPTAYSLISDYFDRHRRALAISFYAIGYPVGSGLALIIGAALLKYFDAQGGADLGLLGSFNPWQMVFISVGAPGIFVAMLIWTIREPKRRELAVGYSGSIPLRDAYRYVAQRWKLYGTLIGSLSLIALLSIGTTLWYPTFLIRTYGMSITDVGFYYGAVMLVFGTIGTICGGFLSGWLMKRGRQDANMQIVLFATLLKGLPLVIGCCQSDGNLSPIGVAWATPRISQAARFCHSAMAAERRALYV